MKAKVIIDFIDKKTRKLRKKDEIIDLTEARFKEINATSKRVQAVKEETEKKTEIEK